MRKLRSRLKGIASGALPMCGAPGNRSVCPVAHGQNETTASSNPVKPVFSQKCIAPRGQFPHEEYCHRYYDCWDGEISVQECPGELLFNSDPQKYYCDYPESVDCAGRTVIKDPSVKNEICPRSWGIFPDTTNCAGFYLCVKHIARRVLCPINTVYHIETKVCTHVATVDCTDRGVPSWGFEEDVFKCPDARGIYTHTKKCDQYWECSEFKPQLKTCPQGQLFDQYRLLCDLAENVLW
ncbi:uncharacterized protein LOC143247616 isoform X1 [Tachypleus tridentatus]|uniref:uncharacterized protein LOC143247616 isoform X1 n=1 Tax=Tachypleus tridentatus TaxID=6853 RepID=UPI003FD0EC34